MAVEPSVVQHLSDWLQPASTAILLLYAAWNYKLGKRVDTLEIKVETYRSEREMELKFLQDQMKAAAELLKETEARLAGVSDRLIAAQTKLDLTLDWFQTHFAIVKGGEV